MWNKNHEEGGKRACEQHVWLLEILLNVGENQVLKCSVCTCLLMNLQTPWIHILCLCVCVRASVLSQHFFFFFLCPHGNVNWPLFVLHPNLFHHCFLFNWLSFDLYRALLHTQRCFTRESSTEIQAHTHTVVVANLVCSHSCPGADNTCTRHCGFSVSPKDTRTDWERNGQSGIWTAKLYRQSQSPKCELHCCGAVKLAYLQFDGIPRVKNHCKRVNDPPMNCDDCQI